ncbi:hypothetical protein EDB81DRAFT_855975 [Dactylonectria macrodidyma]|uniref:Phenylacetyl-CoA ligase n=1 Tax=Dactylonectria macrodidyma TaxID=307937 RepID=A0A9P9EXS2_9HYPO|nr:hypothetical protein EDB81DRAFT_855975 [Dactylonectria macrodidyma]
MVFKPPAWVPQLPFEPPDSVPIFDFLNDERYGRQPLETSLPSFTCGITGKKVSPLEVRDRAECLARALSSRMQWEPNTETPWDKVVCIFSVNTVDYIPVAHAVHRLSGIVTTANAVFSATELEVQLRSSGAKAIVTCVSLLSTAQKAAQALDIPDRNIFIMDVAGDSTNNSTQSIETLVAEGSSLPVLPPLKWSRGQGARQVAFLCYSSGTSGLPKGVMISHLNVISNIMQLTTLESVGRKQFGVATQVELGLLPFSHIYGLVFITHMALYRGDEVIVLPRFEFDPFLKAVERFRIEQLLLVPPIIIQLTRNISKVLKYDLSSVRCVYTAAAPLGRETANTLRAAFPRWNLTQGYGLTETSPVVSSTGENDMLFGSAGCLLPGTLAKIIDSDGNEVQEHGKPGELLVQSPAVTLGYLNNEKATAETFIVNDSGRWLRTGDEVCIKETPSGDEHLVILDRIKELIKVKGHQVAPAELESHLLAHPAVDDCAVVQVADDSAGELPKAFVVKSALVQSESDEKVSQEIHKHFKDHKAHYKWLKGGIEFIEAIPKSPSGKILRRLLRDREKQGLARGSKL